VARAKRTDRAEARRRYRAELATRDVDESEAAEADEPAAMPPTRAGRAQPSTRRAAPARPAEPARAGFFDGFRSALQPANFRADVAAAPSLLRTSPLLWIPFVLVIVSGVIALVPSLAGYQIPAFLVQTFVFPPPLIAPFLAGLLAPRAGWLFGLLTGLVAAVMFALLAATTPGTSPAGGPTITPDVRVQYILYGLVTSPTFGAAIGAFAGFYRRFLRSTSARRPAPDRSRRQAARSRR
jgi:hypothetical protein